MPIALVDGDIVAYRAAAAVINEEIDWGDGYEGPSSGVDTALAIRNAKSLARKWVKEAGCSDLILYLSDNPTFRHEIYPQYKANRDGLERPPTLQACREALKEEFRTFIFPRLEADDVIGIVHTSDKFETIAVSIDKDFQTLPGLLFNPLKDKKPRNISLDDANRYWLMQAMIGDTIDGYKGCSGVGPAKARKLLEGVTNLKQMVRLTIAEFIQRGHSKAEALLQMRLARILRREDYNKETGEIVLWHP